MKRNKKGFTIIELVIVIAVIGVLTAVLVPVFINLTNKANKAADDSLIKNLNTALKMEEQLVGNPKNETLQDAIEDLKNEGYLLENLVSKTGHDLLWDQEQNQFVLNEKTDLKDGKYWQIVDKIPETQRFSYYAGKNFKDTEVLDLEYGFDAGEYSKIENLEYEPKSGTAKTTRIRTNSDETTLTINAPLDVVKHYGDAKALNIIAVKGSSYHENGKVSFLEISKGRVVLEYDSQVKHIHVSAKTDEQGQKLDVFDSVTIAKEPTKEMPVLSRDDVEIASTGTLVVALQNGTEEVTEQSNLDYVWLTKQGIYEQIKISDSSASAGNVWVSDSDKSEQTKTAAQQIANNYISETVRPTWESTDTERDIANINNKTEVATAVAQEEAGEAWEEMTPAEKAAAVDAIEAVVVDKDIAVEKVADKKDVEKGATLFGGGTGSERDPFLIVDQPTFQHVGDFYNEQDSSQFYYWRVKDGISEIDMTGWSSINLQGSIEGNNVLLKNLTSPLFEKGALTTEELTLSNFNIESNIVKPGGWTAVVFRSYPGSNLLLDNVDITGYIEGNAVASYIIQNGNDLNLTIKDCDSSLTMFGSSACGGVTGYLGMGTSNTTMNVVNSKYNGTMIRSANSNFSYFGFNNNSSAHISITLDQASCDADFTIKGNAPEAKTYTGTWAQLGNCQTVYTNSSKKVVGSLTISVSDNKVVAAKGNSTRAVATLMVGPNPGNMYTGYYTEELTLNGDNWISNTLKVFVITCDNTKPIGISADGLSFNVHGADGNIHIANIVITEYDSQGNVINVGTYQIPVSNYPGGRAY